ncbi:MAG TPA: T9SS type A sorting domain-containing protein [Candidatus Kapabacteria bacterium]|nr:T9SS type A sorting domain-containing protein [Candidatus Kapabacteria bacterium]
MLKFYLTIIGMLFFANGLFSEPQVDISVDNNWVDLSIKNFESHCYAKYIVDFSIQNNTINVILSDTSEQKCKSKCNIELELDIYQVPQGNYVLNLYLDESNGVGAKEAKKLISKKDIKISSNYAKAPLSYSFRHTSCTGINESPVFTGLEVYPNPATSKLTLKFDLKSRADVNFKVLNFLGKEVLNYDKKNMPQGVQLISLDSENLQPGMYIGKFTASNGQVYSVKLLWSK